MKMANLEIAYIAISAIALALIFYLLYIKRKEKPEKLSNSAVLAFAFVIAGIIFGEDRLIGYCLIGIGVLIAIFDILDKSQKKRKGDAEVKKRAPEKTDMRELKRKVLLRFGLAPIAIGLCLFLPAGSLNYWQAWLYCGVLFIPMFFVVSYFFRNDPALLERRMRMREKQKGQKALIKFGYVLFILGFLIPGLDFRFGWSDVPTDIVFLSCAIVFLSYLAIILVFKENSYASRIIEVEAGQKVISTGPYAVVRHPMYTGVLFMYLFTPLALGSYWALIPFLLLIPIFVYRIINEEKVLREGLPGYKEYCKKVRCRLIPHVW